MVFMIFFLNFDNFALNFQNAYELYNLSPIHLELNYQKYLQKQDLFIDLAVSFITTIFSADISQLSNNEILRKISFPEQLSQKEIDELNKIIDFYKKKNVKAGITQIQIWTCINYLNNEINFFRDIAADDPGIVYEIILKLLNTVELSKGLNTHLFDLETNIKKIIDGEDVDFEYLDNLCMKEQFFNNYIFKRLGQFCESLKDVKKKRVELFLENYISYVLEKIGEYACNFAECLINTSNENNGSYNIVFIQRGSWGLKVIFDQLAEVINPQKKEIGHEVYFSTLMKNEINCSKVDILKYLFDLSILSKKEILFVDTGFEGNHAKWLEDLINNQDIRQELLEKYNLKLPFKEYKVTTFLMFYDDSKWLDYEEFQPNNIFGFNKFYTNNDEVYDKIVNLAHFMDKSIESNFIKPAYIKKDDKNNIVLIKSTRPTFAEISRKAILTFVKKYINSKYKEQLDKIILSAA